MKRGRPILEEVVLAKYDGERPTKPFLTPVRGGCTPTLTHVSFENMGRGKNQGYTSSDSEPTNQPEKKDVDALAES